MNERELLAKVQSVVQPFGCIATELGPNSVGVMGDARFYGPSVYITFPPNISMEEVSRISTRITNEIPGISRVLMNIV